MNSLTFSLSHLFPPRFCDLRAQRHLHLSVLKNFLITMLSNTCSIKVNPAEHPFLGFLITAWIVGMSCLFVCMYVCVCFLTEAETLPLGLLSYWWTQNAHFFPDSNCFHSWEDMSRREIGSYEVPGFQELYKTKPAMNHLSTCYLTSSPPYLLYFHRA